MDSGKNWLAALPLWNRLSILQMMRKQKYTRTQRANLRKLKKTMRKNRRLGRQFNGR